MYNKMTKLVGAIAFLVLINVGLFSWVSVRLTTFWVSWSFIHIAFLLFVGIVLFSASEQKKLKFMYSETAIATYYLVVEAISGFVLTLYFAFFPVVAFVVQTALLGAFLVVFCMVKKTNQLTDAREEAAKADRVQFQAILNYMSTVQDQVDYNAPYRKTIQHAYDALRGSQVESSEQVYEIERAIWDLIGQLKEAVLAGEEDHIRALCREIENQTAERRRRLLLER